MKTTIKTFAIALVFASSQAFAGSTEVEVKSNTVEQALPATAPSIESPTPQRVVGFIHERVLTPAQKAAIVELSFTNLEK
jgi:hypothetical protein